MARPVLRTERLLLEPLGAEHAELLVELDSDPAVLRYVFGRALTRAEVLDEWLPRRTRTDADARGIGYWAGYEGERFAGWWSLAVDESDPDAAELGYRLGREFWGRGLATEGARALLEHGFGTVGLARIWAETMWVNTGSRRVLDKLGMRQVRRYVGEWPYPVEGWEQGEVVYEVRPEAL